MCTSFRRGFAFLLEQTINENGVAFTIRKASKFIWCNPIVYKLKNSRFKLLFWCNVSIHILILPSNEAQMFTNIPTQVSKRAAESHYLTIQDGNERSGVFSWLRLFRSRTPLPIFLKFCSVSLALYSLYKY